jgi:hypothetical protein
MSKSTVKTLSTIVFSVAILALMGGLALIYIYKTMGTNFVHGPSQEDYVSRLKSRVTFSISNVHNFDSAFSLFLKENPSYISPDNGLTEKLASSCDCYTKMKLVLLETTSKNSYLVTFDTGNIRVGAIDLAYFKSDLSARAIKTADLDSAEKEKIRAVFKKNFLDKIDN